MNEMVKIGPTGARRRGGKTIGRETVRLGLRFLSEPVAAREE